MNHRDILRYKVQLEQQGLSAASVALALVALALVALKSLFKWLKKLRYVTENPTMAIEIPKNTKDESKALSDEQVQALYGALEERKRTLPLPCFNKGLLIQNRRSCNCVWL